VSVVAVVCSLSFSQRAWPGSSRRPVLAKRRRICFRCNAGVHSSSRRAVYGERRSHAHPGAGIPPPPRAVRLASVVPPAPQLVDLLCGFHSFCGSFAASVQLRLEAR